MRLNRILLAAPILFGLTLFSQPAPQMRAPQSKWTALDRYIAQPDPAYKYSLVNKFSGKGFTGYILEMDSQNWLTTAEVDRPLWKHWVTIVVPEKLNGSTGLMVISGGANGGRPPARPDGLLVGLATSTNSVVSEIKMIPNQALTFTGDHPRKEDALIAYTWDKYLRTGDAKWPARLPMTKAVVRAMDTVTAFCGSPEGGAIKVEHFVVTGASKRGWTTWTTAVTDRRVVAIAPLVIDMLNIVPSFEHHYRAYGFWAPAVHDYVVDHIMERSGTREYKALMKIVEPYEYRDRLTMPKYIINASGDQFFLPDSSQFYFDKLKGEKHLRYVPNADHSLRGSDAVQTLQSFYGMVISGKERPKYSWKFEKDGSIRVKTAARPTEVKLWQATNPAGRDFRLEKIGKAWSSKTLEDQGGGTFVGRVEKPAAGFTAYFVEMTFDSGTKYPVKFTSGIRVSPDVLPFPKPPQGVVR